MVADDVLVLGKLILMLPLPLLLRHVHLFLSPFQFFSSFNSQYISLSFFSFFLSSFLIKHVFSTNEWLITFVDGWNCLKRKNEWMKERRWKHAAGVVALSAPYTVRWRSVRDVLLCSLLFSKWFLIKQKQRFVKLARMKQSEQCKRITKNRKN